ncbi:MAG: hypothetical protein H6912_03220 [Kordiimonadaceae bacterium]|nr:hypothetical protein [Kordiimonadaceae bacterium]
MILKIDKNFKILIVEDSEIKWIDIEKVLLEFGFLNSNLNRVGNIIGAEEMISKGSWDLMILDISLDLMDQISEANQGAHEVLGGLSIANKMYLLGKEVPTIIVTAFDAFPSKGIRSGYVQILSIEEVNRRAQEMLDSAYIGYVQYGEKDWQSRLNKLLKEVLIK